MILAVINYAINPGTLTAILSAILGALVVAVVLAFGTLYLKHSADKKKMDQDVYSHVNRFEIPLKGKKKKQEQRKNKKNKKK